MRKWVIAVLAVGIAASHPVSAGLPDTRLDVKADKKLYNTDRSRSYSTTATNQRWGYNINIRNTSFKDIPNAKMEYQIIMKDQNIGEVGHPKLKRITGEKEIGNFLKNAQITAETEKVELDKAELNAGWYYANGSRTISKDSIMGILIRIVSDGNVVFQTSVPETLAAKEVWEAPIDKNTAIKKKP